MNIHPPIESVVHDEWHVLCAASELAQDVVRHVILFGLSLAVVRGADGTVRVYRDAVGAGCSPAVGAGLAVGDDLPVRHHCGYVWSTLGEPAHELFAVPECFESDRRLVHCGTFGVHVSAPRAVENFLDMAHFPFVHRGILGVEPHTEVRDYDVTVSADAREVVARRCRFYQPLSAVAARTGFDVEYVYRIPHPFCSVLYKSSALDTARNDVIAMFTSPISEERISASLFMALVDDESSDVALVQFQQTIFGQDKPILENQRPRRLPLDPAAETSVRADRGSVAYRRWLHERGVRYGTIPWNNAPPNT